MSDDPLVEVAEDLYALTPNEFTAARNEEAKRVKADGDKALADRVKALPKPSTAAWVVNLLVREEPDEMRQLLDVGESLQRAQADLDADAMRELNRQRRRLIVMMAQRGRGLARERGVKVSDAVAEQVEGTLYAAMIDPDAATAVRTGMLVEPLAPEGFGSLKAASALEHTALRQGSRPAAAKKPSTGGRRRTNAALSAVPDADPEERRREERHRARQEAEARVAEAQSMLEQARNELEARERAVSDLQAACLQVNGEIDELKRRIDELEDRLEKLDDDADDARAERDEAAEAVAVAEQALAESQATLAGLTD